MPPVAEAPALDLRGHKIRKGKCFEAGNYPDKRFKITPDEMREAAQQFQPVPIDLEHKPSILDGKLGHLLSVQMAEDGKSLIGEAAIPEWLELMVPANKREVSLTWDRQKKQIVGMALVLKPRVSDAALLSAFAQFEAEQKQRDGKRATMASANPDDPNEDDPDSPTGDGEVDPQETHQMVHDMMVDLGARCEDYGQNQQGGAGASASAGAGAEFRHDTYVGQSTLQMIHDEVTRHGALCGPDVGRVNMHSAHELQGLQKVHEICVEHGASCHDLGNSPSGMAGYSGGSDSMGKMDEMKAFFREKFGLNLDEEGGGAATATTTVTTEPDNPQIAELRAQVEAANRRADEAWNRQVATEAAAFAETVITQQHRAFPAERNNIIAQYIQFAKDDRNSEEPVKVSFGEGESAFTAEGRLEAFRKSFDLRTAHGFTYESVPSGLVPMSVDTPKDEIEAIKEEARRWAGANGAVKKGGSS